MFFYLPPERWTPPFCLDGQEVRHITKVLRLEPGATLHLLDGAGREGLFRMAGVRKERVELALLSEKTHPVPACRAILAVAWSKAIRRGFFLEKAVELGAAEIWCWQARRSQGRMPDDMRESWQGRLVAGLKQCGNPYLPLVRVFFGGARELAVHAPEYSRILLHEPGEHCPMLDFVQLGRKGDTVYVIGPEGGFDPQETETLINAGYAPASLGERPLRWETAAIMCLSLHRFCSAHTIERMS
jgi:16S rRNA (uracil1498-N3)-methyltransferase